MILPLHIIIVPAHLSDRCDAIARTIGIAPNDPDAPGYSTIIRRLVPASGPADAAATHRGVQGCMSEAQRIALLTALAQPANADIAAAAYWLRLTNHGSERGKVQASHDSERIDERWSWEQALAELDLQMQQLPFFTSFGMSVISLK